MFYFGAQTRAAALAASGAGACLTFVTEVSFAINPTESAIDRFVYIGSEKRTVKLFLAERNIRDASDNLPSGACAFGDNARREMSMSG